MKQEKSRILRSTGASTTLRSLFEIVHGRFRFCNVIDNTISHAPRILIAEHARETLSMRWRSWILALVC